MVDIRLFGKLRRFIKEPEADHANIIRVAPQPEETLQQLLARIGIPIDEIYTIFLNSKLLASRTLMAYRMGYQQVHEDPLDWNLEVALKAGDRIGLFGRDMAALVV
jgi:molybdopterin converting factor small subunit